MAVPFTQIPSNLRTPLFYVEFDNSMANTATTTQRTLIIGQKLDSAGAQANIPQKVSSASTVAGICGSGSMLHNMMTAYLANDSTAEIWILALPDAAGYKAASGEIKINSVATETGVIAVYIGGGGV